MYISEIEFGSPNFDCAIQLRHLVLREPLNMVFHTIDIAKEASELHFALFNQYDVIIACLSVRILTNTLAKVRQVAVAPHLQGKGLGKKLGIGVEKILKSKGFDTIELHARSNAIPFYEKLSYKSVGNMFEEVGIKHIKMLKKL